MCEEWPDPGLSVGASMRIFVAKIVDDA